MKEMLGNLADGQIELYRSVSVIPPFFFSAALLLIYAVLGSGGVG